MSARVRVFAPATVANLGPGYDVLGLALERPGDLVEAELSQTGRVDLVEVSGDDGVLSLDPAKNVTAVAAQAALVRARTHGTASDVGVRLWLTKQMPLASGLGSSGASSAAGASAVNELLGRPLSPRDVLLCAMEGERVASGSAHADNVAPSILGGIVLIARYHPLEILSLPVPPDLWVAVVHPHYELPTAKARALVTDRSYTLSQVVVNLGGVGGLVDALHRGDLDLLGRSVTDALVEPVRASLIPGFAAVKAAALEAGARGCSIAGAGPSVFGFAADGEGAARVAAAMQAAFRADGGLESDVYVGRINKRGTVRLD